MIKLMEISEIDTILYLWNHEMKELTGLDKEIDDYAPALEEALGHGNVYVAHNGEEIIGFAAVMEGFFISDIIFNNDVTGENLVIELKDRYDELQTDVHHKHKANVLLPKLGFKKLEESKHDILGFDEIEYEWLSE